MIPAWTVCRFSAAGELAIAAAAIGLGGHIRGGFRKTTFSVPDGSILSGNAEQVARGGGPSPARSGAPWLRPKGHTMYLASFRYQESATFPRNPLERQSVASP